jgi:hypothetical protein
MTFTAFPSLLAAAGLAVVLTSAVAPVHANAPDMSFSTASQNKQVMGSARLKVWGFDIYDMRLKAGPGFDAARFADGPLALELSYLRNLKGADIAERSLDEMRNLETSAPAQAEAWLAAMRDLFPDVKKGDRLAGVHQPGRGALFFMNDRLLGEVADERFSRLFFGIWLSPKTSQPAMRETLLQGLAPLARRP